MNRIKEVTVIAFCLGLVGCSTTGQDNFSTEPGKGYGWKSMNETHQIIQREMSGFNAPQPITPQPYVVSSANFEGIQRIPEQYLRIWIPPYQDMQGNLHEESSIQTVIRTGQWKLTNPAISEHRKA